MKKYILTRAEYRALDKALDRSKMADDGQMLYQYEDCDYFAVFDEDYLEGFDYEELVPQNTEFDESIYIVPLSEYMEELDSELCDFVGCYSFTKTDVWAYDELLKKFGCFKKSCKER